MSLREVPPFESLTQGATPYSGFGPLLVEPDAAANFSRVIQEASVRISETFGVSPPADRTGIATLEELVARMWREGWDPERADVNLFVRDLGSVFMFIVQQVTAAEAVFRSSTDLSHASLWWPKKRVEIFPFHKIYRRLTDRDGESLVYFLDSLTKKLAV